jgi:hypothetical protein
LEKPVKASLHTESEINRRHFIGGSDAHVIMGRASGVRPAPTFSSVEEAHAGLIERLAALKVYRILYIADARDLEERAEHLQQVLGAVLDVAADVASSIANAADDLAAGMV